MQKRSNIDGCLSTEDDGLTKYQRYHLRHKEERNRQSREYQREHAEEHNEHSKQWEKANYDKIRPKKQQYYAQNHERILANMRQRYQTNKEAIREKRRASLRQKKEYIVRWLGGKCALCGYSRCAAALEIHHKKGKSKKDTLYRVKGTVPLETTLKNINPKEVLLVCSNCQREIHHSDWLEKTTTPPFLGENCES